MSLELTDAVNSSIRTLTITGTVPATIRPGYQFFLDSEAVLLQGFGRTTASTRLHAYDQNVWRVKRAILGSTAAAHDAAVEIRAIADDIRPASSETPETVTGFELAETYSGTGSHQTVAPDLTLAAAAGSSSSSKYLAAVMGNILGASLTKAMTYVGGLIGKYSITGAAASSYPHAAVIAEVGSGTIAADAAVMAVLGGDDGLTTVRAMFGVDNQNSTPNSKADFGLDLQGVTHDSYGLLEVTTAARLGNDVCILVGDGAPTTGASGTGDNIAGPGSIYVDYTNGNAYLQTGAITSPVWKLVTRAA